MVCASSFSTATSTCISHMKINVQSSKAVKPDYGGGDAPAAADTIIPLTVFDLISFDDYMFGIHAFHPPSPPTAALEAGLARALAEYREWAGRLCVDPATGRRGILLNDAGVRFVEAAAAPDGATLESAMPLLLQPTPEVRRFHPSGGGADDDGELMLVQVTRFACGSLVVGHAMYHAVGDGFAISRFLVAWGQATRGVAIDPVPVHDRTSFFVPRDPPRVEFEHRGAEFKKPREDNKDARKRDAGDDDEVVVVHQVRFSREFITELKSRASSAAAGAPGGRPYSTTECLAAHLWRCVTAARGLDGGRSTSLHLAVNGRARMRLLPEGYTGNAVLWAHPTTTARELVSGPLGRAAELIRGEVARVDEAYFRSFVDFASSGAVEEEGLVPASGDPDVLGPDVAVYCLLRIPFYDVNFGGGRQFFYTPGYYPADGVVYILPPSPLGDGSVEAHMSLYGRAMETFKGCCFSLGEPGVVLQENGGTSAC